MNLDRQIARAILHVATVLSPVARKEWATAMSGEVEAIDGLRLGWAIGCLISSAGWRVRADGPFLLFAVALIPGFSLVAGLLEWPLYSRIGRGVYALWLFNDAAFAFLLALWRPIYVAPICFMTLMWVVITRLLFSASVMHATIPVAYSKFVIMDANPVVGLSAKFGWMALGGLAGLWMKRQLHSIAA